MYIHVYIHIYIYIYIDLLIYACIDVNYVSIHVLLNSYLVSNMFL